MLIALEGIDGSGKTTLATALREGYPRATHTHEPTDTWYGDAVRRSIDLNDADPLAELFLYTADHAAHLAQTVKPALEGGKHVITDRYVDSRYAYQGAALGDQIPDALEFVQRVHQPWTRPPDATVYLDVDPETGADRSDEANKFERVPFLELVRANYERLIEAEPDRFIRIDAARPIAAVTEDATAAIEALLE